MNRLKIAAIAAGVAGLAACNNTPQEQKADNIEQAAENTADNMEEAADNMTGNSADAMNNKADVVREKGEEKADSVRTTPDLDGNSANDMVSGNSTNHNKM